MNEVDAAARSLPGYFLTFEGGDGAGKTTQLNLLNNQLTRQGYTTLVTREPGGTPLGCRIRELLLHGEHVDSRAEALLYAADRAHHVSSIVLPALARGTIVLQDRYIDSSVAYQSAGRALAQQRIRELNEWATQHLWPQLTVLLDIDPERALQRHAATGQPSDRIERESMRFHAQVRERYLQLAAAAPDRFLVLDATTPAAQLHTEILAKIAPLLPPPGKQH